MRRMASIGRYSLQRSISRARGSRYVVVLSHRSIKAFVVFVGVEHRRTAMAFCIVRASVPSAPMRHASTCKGCKGDTTLLLRGCRGGDRNVPTRDRAVKHGRR